jgi:galactokinase
MENNNNRAVFKKEFGHDALYEIVTPSRINLIGEHSDYYDNPVLPMAIDNVKMVSLVRPRLDNLIRIHSKNISELEEPRYNFSIMDNRSKLQWIQYVQGAIAMYAEEYTRKKLKGLDILIDSSIPIGGGLSSSSALTMTALAAFGLANDFTDGNLKVKKERAIDLINKKETDQKSAKLLDKFCMMGCWAEYWYGTRDGAMDHFAITVSKKGYATLLDNRHFTYKYVPINENLAMMVCNTMVRHNQLYSGFKDRKETAMHGFAKLHRHFPKAKSIADITLEQLNRYKKELTKDEYHKMKHPITEKIRVFEFVAALKVGDYIKLGRIANAAFASLRDEYDVSCPELNIMQKAATDSPGCFGARITGGGFGGSIVAFVDQKKKADFVTAVKKSYDKNPTIAKKGIKSEIWEARSGDGLIINCLS